MSQSNPWFCLYGVKSVMSQNNTVRSTGGSRKDLTKRSGSRVFPCDSPPDEKSGALTTWCSRAGVHRQNSHMGVLTTWNTRGMISCLSAGSR